MTRSETESPEKLARPILLGFVASCTIVVGGALAGAAETTESAGMWTVPSIPVRLSFPLLPALILFYGGMVLFLRAWMLLRRHHRRHGLAVRTVVGIIVIWSLPLLIGPPLGSRDVYAYAAQGRAADFGFDIYRFGPSVLGSQDPMLTAVDPWYYDSPVVYGPVFVTLSSWVSKLAGDGVVVAVLLFRFVATLSLAVASFGVYDIAKRLNRDPIDALILGVANPLALLHLISGAHNEALMLGFLVGGIAIGMRPKLRLVGVALCAFAAAIKVPALLGAAFLSVPWIMAATSKRVWVGRAASAGAVVIGTVALAGRLTGFGWGWVGAISSSDPIDAYLSVTTLSGFAVSWVTGLELGSALFGARVLGYVGAAATTLILLLRHRSTWPEALAWSLLVAAVLHPTTQPWYLTWSTLLLAAVYGGRRNRPLVAVCAIAAFSVMPAGPRLGHVLLDSSDVGSIAAGLALVLLLTLDPKSFDGLRRTNGDTASRTSYRVADQSLTTIIVPVRNNIDQVRDRLHRIASTVDASAFEILVVADSVERHRAEIGNIVADVSSERGVDAPLLRLIGYPSEQNAVRGSGAICIGFAHARGAKAIVVDGRVGPVPDFHAIAKQLDWGTDLCVSSRRAGSELASEHGPAESFSRQGRAVCRLLFPSASSLTNDPLSDSFGVWLDRIDVDRLHPDGSKLLLEILVAHRQMSVADVQAGAQEVDVLKGRARLLKNMVIVGHLLDLWVRSTGPWAADTVPERSLSSV